MTSDDEPGTPPGTPPKLDRGKRKRSKKTKRRKRRSSSSSSNGDEFIPRKVRKTSSKLSTKYVLELFKTFKGESSKNSFFSNNNLNNVIPEYDPSNRAQTMECWLRKVNECALIYGWDDKQTIHFSLQKLVGLAKKWFEALPTVVYTWSEWQSKLRKAFPSEENFGRLLEEMLNRTPRTDESLREYFYDKLTLLNRCEISGKKAVDCIIHGITDRSIRNGAQALNCTEPEDLLNFLSSQKTQMIPNSKFRDRQPQKSIIATSSNNNGNSHTTGIRSSSVVCYNCRSRGHPYYRCPKPLLRCKRCQRIGHDNDNCKLEPIQVANSSSNLNANNVQNSAERKVSRINAIDTNSECLEHDNYSSKLKLIPDVNSNFNSNSHNTERDNGTERKIFRINTVDTNAKFQKKTIVDDLTYESFIDFGSECTLMRKTDAEVLKGVRKTDNLPIIKGFGESSVLPLYEVTAIVKIDEIEAPIDILVVDDKYLESSILIGQNFTELPYLTALKNYRTLKFYLTPCQDEFSTGEPIKLFVSSPVEVSTTSVIPVRVDSNYTGDVYVDGYIRVEPGRECRLFQGAYHIKDGIGNVVMSNLSHCPVTLSENSLIARAVPFVEHEVRQVNRVKLDDPSVEPLDKNEIKTGPAFDDKQKDRLYTLLQNYRDCFATKLSEVGCVAGFKMKIDLVDNKPIVYRPYRLSFFEREQVRETIDELLRNDIIQESTSDYASPILMVKKKTGEMRLCVDFRALNNKTVKDRFPLPLIDDQVSNLSGNNFFTTLDLASGYYQIQMAEESQHLTGFVTPDGHYEFKRMPFGLANAPAVFQRLINKILGNRRFEYALAYLDDVLIPARDVEEMFQRLEEVLKLFRVYGLTLKLSKCRFFDTTVNYLGYDISSQGIQPSEAKVLAVKEFPAPQNVHEVRQFLGLTGYFRKFIKGYGEIARPLTSLLKKETAWQWSDLQKQAFNLLKESLVSRPVLALYDATLETELHTDASSLGVGSILMQWQRDTHVLKPVCYFSRQTTPEERHLHSYELETLAVVCSLKKFRVYLLGIHFKIYTDCAALRTTLTKRDLVPRIARWWLQISEFTFDIEYRPGVQMAHVDALSRNTKLSVETDDNPLVNVYHIEKENWLLTLQIADPEIERIHKLLKPESDPEYTDIKQHFVEKNHAVYRKVDDRLCLVVPRSARWQICRANHDEIGHLGYTKTLEKIQHQYWFPKLRKFVKKYVAACLECAYNKDNAAKQKTGHLYPIEKYNIPFHTVHIDHLGPFVKSKDGNAYILTVVDGFTKYVFVRAVRDVKTRTTIKVLERIFYDFGVPARIVSDRGTSFTSVAFKAFCETHGIKHILNAVACPRANGQAERFNQTILHSLSAQNSFGHEKDWDKCLGKIQWGINNTVNATTQKTPTEAMFGIKMRDALSNKLDNNSNEATSTDIQKIREDVSKNIEKDQIKQKERHDADRSPAIKYELGDLVKIARNNFDNDKKSAKLLSKFVGPYKITEVLGNDRYRIAEVPGFSKRGKPYNTVIAFDRIRPWIHIKSLELHETDKSSTDDSE
ncbi:hypothetical protein O0L34_g6069 [Tuta absoluta]|nr:hypothetical protein O0L34_g6069 [Tuta absoluta]